MRPLYAAMASVDQSLKKVSRRATRTSYETEKLNVRYGGLVGGVTDLAQLDSSGLETVDYCLVFNF